MSDERGAISLAEKVLTMLEVGRKSATYKYALFTAMLDLVLERASSTGEPPTSLTTRQLAEKIIELYWSHTTPYEGGRVLRQGGNHDGEQAEIVTKISAFRQDIAGSPGDSVFRARVQHPDTFERMVRFVEWKLIEMPIPRLQNMGAKEDRFLYDYDWGGSIKRGVVAAYQRGESGSFNNVLRLKPGVAENLVRLNGVLRPVIQREWTLKVAAFNALPEGRLADFMFGVSRVSLDDIRAPLRDLQSNRCFYCEGRMEGPVEVDHFIPWARYADNRLDNLLVAHAACNNAKRDFFAAADHVERWARRAKEHTADLAAIASLAGWEREPSLSRSVAIAMYGRLSGDAKLWLAKRTLVPIERDRIVRALGGMAG